MTHSHSKFFWFRALSLLFILSLLISACSPTAPQAQPTTQSAADQPPAAPSTVETTLAEPTPSKAPAKPTPSLSPTPAGPLLKNLRPLTAEELAKPETYHHAVLFIAKDFFLSGQDVFRDPQMPQEQADELWLLKPDEQAIGRVSPQGFNTAIYQEDGGPVKLISYQTPAEKALIQAMGWEEVLAPELCRLPADGSKPVVGFKACTDLRFTADGRFLSYQIPTGRCGGEVRILNLDKRKHVVTQTSGGHWSLPLPSGQILYALGQCEGGKVYRFDPATGKADVIGLEPAQGELQWNPQQTAFVADVGDEAGYSVELWGYNSETDKLFMDLRPHDSSEFDKLPTWTPDGQALLFQRQTYTRNAQNDAYVFNHPSEIIKVGVDARTQTKVAADPKYNYRIGFWSGDYLLIKRYPFKALTLAANTVIGPDSDKNQEARCVAYGHDEDCGQPELFAYNAKTDQLIPWAETALPTPGPRQAASNPDPDGAAKAFYEDKGGAYKLVQAASNPFTVYGPAGWVDRSAGSLWMVPKDGEPQPWVDHGWGFTLLP